MNFTSDIVIGLEIHAELDTKTKLFCACEKAKADSKPNTHTCVTCLGMPGSKPVLNGKALEYGIQLCLALGCKVAPSLVFSRKSYFYPDLAKNYQITQYELPLGEKGKVKLDQKKTVGITRAHLEEDPASLTHPGGMQKASHVLIDYNRSGNPLIEIVTEPDMENPEQARQFMKKLITTLQYLEIFDVKTGIIKADANISIKESGYVRSEVKNVTGFKEIERALFYEVERQKIEVKEGKKLVQDTRAWDAENGKTFRLRTKETEADYGYILDPDLVPVPIPQKELERIQKSLPELAEDKLKKFVKTHKIPELDAEVLSQEKKLAELFEKVAETVNPILAAKWLRRELVRVMNYNKKNYEDLEIDEKHMSELLELVDKKVITETTGQKIMEKLMEKPFSPKAYVNEHDLGAVRDSGELKKLCKEAINENLQAVEEYKAGNEKSFNFLIGQVMRKTKGKADPKEVNQLMKELL
jgi:aspartyl-tRNA(Asn)/glutamyl-tRNA(Gln) amidotransferase subunit B